jgi:tetratricopeptide (TPR) repeat protein
MKAFFLSAICALATLAIAGCTSAAARSQRFIATGDQYVKTKQWKAASIEYRNAIKRTPNSVEAHDKLAAVSAMLDDKQTVATERFWIAKAAPLNLEAQLAAGDACLSAWRLEDAEAAFAQAVAIRPRTSRPNRALAIFYMQSGNPTKAEPYWTTITTLPDGDPFALADFYAATNRTADAERELRKMSAVPEREEAALLRLAKLFFAYDRPRDGDQTLDVLIARNPHDEAAWTLRGQMLLRRGSENAQQAFLNAFAADSSSIDALTGLTLVDVESNRPDRALARIDDRLRQAPNDVSLLLLSARTYAATDAFDKAAQVLTRIEELDPSNADAHTLMGRVYLGQGRPVDARKSFERAAALAPDSVEANTLVAMLLQIGGHWDEARQRYQQILNANPRAAVAANNLAWLDVEQGRMDEALRYGQVAHEELRGVPHVDDTLGWIYYQSGRVREALPLLASAVGAHPESVLFHYHLGMAYWKAEDTRAARQELNRALTLSPSFAGRDDAVAVLARMDAAH